MSEREILGDINRTRQAAVINSMNRKEAEEKIKISNRNVSVLKSEEDSNFLGQWKSQFLSREDEKRDDDDHIRQKMLASLPATDQLKAEISNLPFPDFIEQCRKNFPTALRDPIPQPNYSPYSIGPVFLGTLGRPFGFGNLFGAYAARRNATSEQLAQTVVTDDLINSLAIAEEHKQRLITTQRLRDSMQSQLIYFLQRNGGSVQDHALRAATNALNI